MSSSPCTKQIKICGPTKIQGAGRAPFCSGHRHRMLLCIFSALDTDPGVGRAVGSRTAARQKEGGLVGGRRAPGPRVDAARAASCSGCSARRVQELGAARSCTLPLAAQASVGRWLEARATGWDVGSRRRAGPGHHCSLPVQLVAGTREEALRKRGLQKLQVRSSVRKSKVLTFLGVSKHFKVIPQPTCLSGQFY